MSNRTSRTNIQDLTSDEKTLTGEEMKNIEGGKNYYESRSNTNLTDSPTTESATPSTVKPVVNTSLPSNATPPVPATGDKKTQTPL